MLNAGVLYRYYCARKFQRVVRSADGVKLRTLVHGTEIRFPVRSLCGLSTHTCLTHNF